MHRKSFASSWLVVLVVAAAPGCNSGGKAGGPTAPPTPPPAPATGQATASFRVSGSGYDQTVSYTDGSQIVRCSLDAGWASLWIRLAEETAADGENGPLIDIDLCSHDGGGAFAPKDPKAATCDGTKAWDIWWHSGDGAVFVNASMAADCELSLDQNGSELSGTFECAGLVEEGGARTVDISAGSFECAQV